MVGFFKQDYVKSMSEQLQNCKITLTSVVCITTLHSSVQQKRATEEMTTTIPKQEAELADSITSTDKQLAEVHAELGVLCLAKQEQDETEVDRESAIGQVAVERTALVESRKLLEQLLSGIHTGAMDARGDRAQAQVVNNFGGQNEGMEVGVSYGTITFTPSKK
ncbi:hypothetical protein GE09DRAFT_469981 [Coniochaeta sp. 2T2.1]|nr:hypothetical protein GE09DRAFT_469981 [Coniochaeta sp. 2T2.1]